MALFGKWFHHQIYDAWSTWKGSMYFADILMRVDWAEKITKVMCSNYQIAQWNNSPCFAQRYEIPTSSCVPVDDIFPSGAPYCFVELWYILNHMGEGKVNYGRNNILRKGMIWKIMNATINPTLQFKFILYHNFLFERVFHNKYWSVWILIECWI